MCAVVRQIGTVLRPQNKTKLSSCDIFKEMAVFRRKTSIQKSVSPMDSSGIQPRLPHWGKKRIRLRPVPGQSAKSDRKAACFPVTLSQPISTIYYLAFVYRGMACHAAGCQFHPYSAKHSFRDYFWPGISSLFAGFFSQG